VPASAVPTGDHRGRDAAPAPDLVGRDFSADAPTCSPGSQLLQEFGDLGDREVGRSPAPLAVNALIVM